METISAKDYLKQTQGKCVKHGSPEHDEQVAVFEYAQFMLLRDIRWGLLFAIPNGGQRNVITAVRLKAEGVKSGVPDIMLPVACGKFHGLFIEMKVGKNKLSENQMLWSEQLIIAGYLVQVCYSSNEAIYLIEQYLKLGNYKYAGKDNQN